MTVVVPHVNVLNDGRHYCLGIGRDAISVEIQHSDGDGSELVALTAAVPTIEGGRAKNDAGTIGRQDMRKSHGDSWFNEAHLYETLLLHGGRQLESRQKK